MGQATEATPSSRANPFPPRPDLAVEVLSKSNTPKEMARKYKEYFPQRRPSCLGSRSPQADRACFHVAQQASEVNGGRHLTGDPGPAGVHFAVESILHPTGPTRLSRTDSLHRVLYAVKRALHVNVAPAFLSVSLFPCFRIPDTIRIWYLSVHLFIPRVKNTMSSQPVNRAVRVGVLLVLLAGIAAAVSYGCGRGDPKKEIAVEITTPGQYQIPAPPEHRRHRCRVSCQIPQALAAGCHAAGDRRALGTPRLPAHCDPGSAVERSQAYPRMSGVILLLKKASLYIYERQARESRGRAGGSPQTRRCRPRTPPKKVPLQPHLLSKESTARPRRQVKRRTASSAAAKVPASCRLCRPRACTNQTGSRLAIKYFTEYLRSIPRRSRRALAPALERRPHDSR